MNRYKQYLIYFVKSLITSLIPALIFVIIGVLYNLTIEEILPFSIGIVVVLIVIDLLNHIFK